MIASDPKIVVLGLGYVGLPLAVALARKFDSVGFDVDQERIDELRGGHDRTREVEASALAASGLKLTSSIDDCRAADIYIVTVPTPVDFRNRPDLGPMLTASRTIATVLDPARRPTVVFESTVYPGVTEEVCGPEIERVGGWKRGRDFRLGYSPERLNPGDRTHTVDKITKIIAAEDGEVLDQLAEVYGAITSGGVFRAASIKAAEAAKVIENAQRDINIAFMNEVAQILSEIDVSVWDVLDACRTKWNFLGFEPGLVGGHCIGVDPYYLSHLSLKLGHHPQVILAGREINDGMGRWIADVLHERRGRKPGSALVLGLTFKPDVPDLRNSRVFDLVHRLTDLGHDVAVADPLADPLEVREAHGFDMCRPGERRYDLVIAAVPHEEYRCWSAQRVLSLVNAGGTVADPKGVWRHLGLAQSTDHWTL